jgi:hypothetical protein
MRTRERAGLSVTGKEGLRDTFSAALLALVVIMVGAFGSLALWSLAMMTPGGAEKNATEESRKCKALATRLEAVVKKDGFLYDATRLIHEVTAFDRLGLQNFLKQLNADERTKDGGATDTICIQKIQKVHNSDQAQIVSA